MNIASSLLLIVCLSICSYSDEPDLPTPPKGYTWESCPEIKGAFLKPNQWFFKREEAKGTLAYFITKEDLRKVKTFTTGITINVVKDVKKKTKKTPSEFAVIYRSEIQKKKGEFEKTWDDQTGPFKMYGYTYVGVNVDTKTRVSSLLIANDKTSTLYFVIFESPVKDWQDSWAIAKTVLDKIYIDDEV